MSKNNQKQLIIMLAVLVGLLILLGAGIGLNKWHEKRSAEAEEAALPRLVTMENVNGLTLTGSDSRSFTLKDDRWTWTGDDTLTLNGEDCEGLAELAKDFTAQRSIPVSDTLDAYGLEHPEQSITFSNDTESVTVYVGAETSTGTWYARTEGTKELFLIDETLPNALEKTVYDMAKVAEYPPLTGDIIKEVTIHGSQNTEFMVQQVETVSEEGDSSEAESKTESHWFKDGTDVTSDSLLTVLRTELDTIAFERMADWKPSEPSAYGLDAPTAVVTVDYMDGDTDKSVTLTIGNAHPEGSYFCTVDSDRDAVYLIAEDSVTNCVGIATHGYEGWAEQRSSDENQ